jgi:tetratricopeptide (TPR) repeat protein
MANRIDELANRLQREGKTAQLESELLAVSRTALRPAEEEAWYHLWGIAAFRRGDRTEAMKRFTEAFEKFPDCAMIRFSLGQEYEYVGNVKRMTELFDSCLFPELPAIYALWQSRYAYLWNQFDKGLEYLQPVIDAYFELKVADDNYLHMRGMPFFGDTWACLGAIYELMGRLDEFREFTLRASQHLSECRFDRLLSFIDSVFTGDFSAVVSYLRESAKEMATIGGPTGYHNMTAAVIRAEMEPDTSIGEKLLDAIKLTDRDFPWLEDIRTLARCSLAHRVGDVERERKLQNDFLQRQRLLFEPNHVFDFRLVAYQERLKPHYWQARQPA